MLRKFCLLGVFAVVCLVDCVLRLWEDIVDGAKSALWWRKERCGSAKLSDGLHVAVHCEQEYLSAGNIEATIRKVAQLSVWMAEEGVKTVTIYDTCGKLRGLVDSLTEAIKEEKHDVKIVVDVDKRRGRSRQKVSRVRVASAVNGRTAIVDYAKNIASGNLLSEKDDINVQDVMDMLDNDPLQVFLDSEPDILLLFSEARLIGSFPPWQLRLTQIQHERNLYEATRASVHDILLTCASTEKRFGR
eukprot:Plantae.Rhodophyta-Purpureofilum_apyrenoidigerum.ctg19673.p1 GENE.Plantae.Rhodophyta-Purpureofilum_apyrenoidigerum.ctg19673~~Plantae.Rhodophyta-Purpureofilum_apyrenoidigerum.ctg19673.p1  ORF type:complete len:245 (+),score=48.45 Plantae.Rhodophyta-Purpureofilum_apyrenoidigerum.ctg19673:185-919(+)